MSDLQLCKAKPLRKHVVGFIANKKSVFEDRKLILSYVVKICNDTRDIPIIV